jgi:hypothetical protein
MDRRSYPQKNPSPQRILKRSEANKTKRKKMNCRHQTNKGNKNRKYIPGKK